MLSSLIEDESRILIYRNVRDRVLRAAPFLSLDSDPYLAAVDGRLVWILDAYTSSPWYPYGQRFDATQIVGSIQEGALSGSVNYIRNSVKVVVDAYEGTMDFHIVDDEDPLIEAWSKAFPDLFNAEEPSEELQGTLPVPGGPLQDAVGGLPHLSHHRSPGLLREGRCLVDPPERAA